MGTDANVPRARALGRGWHGTHTALLLVAWGALIGGIVQWVSRTGAWSALLSYQDHVGRGSYESAQSAMLWFGTLETLGSLVFFATGAVMAAGLAWYAARAPRQTRARTLALVGAAAAALAVVDELALYVAYWIDPDWTHNSRALLRWFWAAPSLLQGVAVACGIAAIVRGTRHAGGAIPARFVAACAGCAAVSFGVPLVRFAVASAWPWPYENPLAYSALLGPFELGVGATLLMMVSLHRRATRPNRSGDDRDWRRWLGWDNAARGMRTFTRGLGWSVAISVIGFFVVFAVAAGRQTALVGHVALAIAGGEVIAVGIMLAGLARFGLVPARSGARHLAVVGTVLVAACAVQTAFVALHIARMTFADAAVDMGDVMQMHRIDVVGRAAGIAGSLVVLASLHRTVTTIGAPQIAARIFKVAVVIAASGGAILWNYFAASSLDDGPILYGDSAGVAIVFGLISLGATLFYIGIARETAYTIEDGLAE